MRAAEIVGEGGDVFAPVAGLEKCEIGLGARRLLATRLARELLQRLVETSEDLAFDDQVPPPDVDALDATGGLERDDTVVVLDQALEPLGGRRTAPAAQDERQSDARPGMPSAASGGTSHVSEQ